MTKHTQGDWTVGKKGEYGTYNANQIHSIDGKQIAQIYSLYNNTTLEDMEILAAEREDIAEGLANARLIAKAPKMYEALRLALVGLQYLEDHAEAQSISTNAHMTANTVRSLLSQIEGGK